MKDISIQPGIVRNIVVEEDDNGGRIFRADVQSLIDLQLITKIQIDQPKHRQYIPVVGQNVLLMLAQDDHGNSFYSRIIAEFGEAPFSGTHEPGEVVIEGNGGGHIYLNKQGDAIMSDEILANVFSILSNIGFSFIGNSFSVLIKDVGQITMTPSNEALFIEEKIEIEKFKSPLPSIKVTITDDGVELNAPKIVIGRAKDPVTQIPNLTGGAVMSLSPIIGDYSIDLMTGRPIPRSANITGTILPTLL